jgi:hypothetical protein
MFSKKKVAAVVALTAFSLASATGAFADAGHPMGLPPQVSTVLSKLVTAGTITQAQSDAITSALQAAAPTAPLNGGPSIGGMGHGGKGMGGFGKNSAAREAVITSTLGITAADLQAARQAGKSLATLAGTKTAALITALVNFEITEVDAAVTAGKLTAAQATTIKANLQTRVTAEVNSTGGRGHMDGQGMAPKIPGSGVNGASTVTRTTTKTVTRTRA